jgi:CTP:molybdopterin cytidylyltransferase MocA
MDGVVLAAGEGTRMRPLTADRPKALVEVAGRPLVAHAVRRLAQAGATDIVVVAPPGSVGAVRAAGFRLAAGGAVPHGVVARPAGGEGDAAGRGDGGQRGLGVAPRQFHAWFRSS